MPYILANCSSEEYPHENLDDCVDNGWIRSGTAAPPRDLNDWYDLVRNTVQHAVDRYGLPEVLSGWEFEVWNEMWGITDADECVLGQYVPTIYSYAARAVKAVNNEIPVGGPAGACSVFIGEFIDQVTAGDVDGDIPLDFITYHQYGNARECGFGYLQTYGDNTSTGFYWEPDCYVGMHEYVARY